MDNIDNITIYEFVGFDYSYSSDKWDLPNYKCKECGFEMSGYYIYDAFQYCPSCGRMIVHMDAPEYEEYEEYDDYRLEDD